MYIESPGIYQTEAEGPTLQEALQDARRFGEINPVKIARLSQKELTDIMCWWRVWVVSLTTLHEAEGDGQQATEYLLEAKEVIDAYYQHPAVIEASEKMERDSEGHKYQMRAAMLRDEGKWYLCMAQLTGNSSFVAQALDCFEKAIQAATENSSTWAVVIMEKETTKRQSGKKIDWGVFSQAYQTAVGLCPQAGGWNRMAATSWCYIKEALPAGRGKDLELGLNNLIKATRNLGFNWVIRYPLWDIVTSLLGVTRRLTYLGG